MHKLTADIAREFRRLAPHEREDVARQLLGFLGAYTDEKASVWRREVWLECEGVLDEPSANTLVELLNETCTPEARGRRGS
jgi:hypothetical protein